MTLKTRKILFSFFLLIFIIVTPLISLYAAGYKIGEGFLIQKTGILVIETEPEGAKIYVNGEIEQNFLSKAFNKEEGFIRTPAKLKNMKPGEYLIKLELEGFWPWEKKIKINPGQSTILEYIALFKKDLPLMLLSGKLKNISLSPNKKYLSAEKDDFLFLFDLEKENTIKITSSSPENSSLSKWSTDDKIFIYNNELFDVNSIDKKISLENLLKENISKITWDVNNGNKFFYIQNNILYQYDLSNKTKEEIIKNEDIGNFFSKDNLLYYIEKNKEQSKLIIVDTKNKKNLRTINVPCSDYEFINKDSKYLNLRDTRYDILYIIDPFLPINQLRDTINNVKSASWINENEMIYRNDFEIWTYNINNLNKKLITRIGEKINFSFWNKEKKYILYSTDNTINVINLNAGEKNITTKLFEINKIADLHINKAGDTIYFYSQIGNQEGYYKLNIK